jgi:hypothetical protein
MQMLLFENEPEAKIEAAWPQCKVHNSVYDMSHLLDEELSKAIIEWLNHS